MRELPRYKLAVGDQLIYHLAGERSVGSAAHGGGGNGGRPSGYSIDWNFHVVACDATGAWRLVFAERRGQLRDGAAVVHGAHTLDMDGFIDIWNDGRLAENWTIMPLADPTAIFPRLPADRAQIAAGWDSTLQLDGTVRRYRAAGAEPAPGEAGWRFVADCHTELDAVYRSSRQRQYTFDLNRGLVSDVTTSLRRGLAGDSQAAAYAESIRLVDVLQRPNAAGGRASQEADRYFAACAEYQRLIDLAFWELRHSSRWLEEAGEALQQFEATAGVDFLLDMARRKLALHNRERDSMLADAERLAPFVDKPAPDWRAADLEGNVHALNGYRGNGVVLCFWSTACSWSLRTLLALDALAGELRGQPVAFLGVSADTNVEAAGFAWQMMKMRFPTILDGSGSNAIAQSYGVDGHPTTVVIDLSGVIRRIRAGYSHQLSSLLRQELLGLVSPAVCLP
jgi:peroxiredoxin